MRRVLPLLVSFATATACRETPVTTWGAATATAPPGHDAQRQRAEAARVALAQALTQRLTAVLQDEGAAAAVRVCRDVAPEIARAVGAEHAVRIGRTSFRLRNPTNTPPAWVMASVREHATQPRFAVSSRGDLGVLTPILLQPLCIVCHGPAEALDAGVRAELARSYPRDEATGFAAGELRGWFWVEVPGGP